VLLNASTLHIHKVHPNLVTFLSGLNEWSSMEQIATGNGWVRAEDLAELHRLGLLETEDEVAGRECSKFEWDPIELAIQRRTARGGYWPNLAGPPPLILPRFTDCASTDLPSPELSYDMTLIDALRRRRTIRTYAERHLRLQELSTLLYHSARVIECISDPQLGSRMLRPFPTAGARSELEIYVISVDIFGLERGAFYFDAMSHRLLRLRDPDDHYAQIIRSVHAAAGGKLSRDPAAVLLITAVFERVLWKYRDLGLSLIYKDVGALFQTLDMVATALDLAPCAIGSGDEAENSRWLGLDPLCESQVGCFVVGPRENHEP